MFVIPINEGSTVPLPAAEVGRASAFRALLVGVPGDLENVEVHFATPTNASGTPVRCDAMPGGDWRVYASGIYFLDEGKAKYRVTARMPQGDSVHLGEGALQIVPSSLNVDAAAIPIVPEDTYLRNPATGLWHKFTCEMEGNNLLPVLNKKGITR